MPKLAGNARCYCGSGKAYKDCHMAEDKAQEEEQRAWDAAAFFLRQEFAGLAREERFAQAFADGLKLFWDEHYTIESAAQMNEDEALRFFDWFVMDHTPEGGVRLLDIYAAERAAALEERERQLVTAWQEARPASAYEVAAVERPSLQLRDLLTGDEVWAEDAAAARELTLGEVLLARLLPVGALVRLAAGAARLPADEAVGLVPELSGERQTFLEGHPGSTWDTFLRARGYLLTHYAMRQAVAHGRPAVHPQSVAAGVKSRAVRQLRKFARR